MGGFAVVIKWGIYYFNTSTGIPEIYIFEYVRYTILALVSLNPIPPNVAAKCGSSMARSIRLEILINMTFFDFSISFVEAEKIKMFHSFKNHRFSFFFQTVRAAK